MCKILTSRVSLSKYVAHDLFFFFQAEDGIRDYRVTGVQTCALPISAARLITAPITRSKAAESSLSAAVSSLSVWPASRARYEPSPRAAARSTPACLKIGRASCRERV